MEEIVLITSHTFPRLVKQMSEALKLNLEYLDEYYYY